MFFDVRFAIKIMSKLRIYNVVVSDVVSDFPGVRKAAKRTFLSKGLKSIGKKDVFWNLP